MFKNLSRTVVAVLLIVVSVVGLLSVSSSPASVSTNCLSTAYSALGGNMLTLVSGKQEAFATCVKGFTWGSNHQSFSMSASPSGLPAGYCAATYESHRFNTYTLSVTNWSFPRAVKNCAGSGIQPQTFSYTVSSYDRTVNLISSISEVKVWTVVVYAGTNKSIGTAGAYSWR